MICRGANIGLTMCRRIWPRSAEIKHYLYIGSQKNIQKGMTLTTGRLRILCDTKQNLNRARKCIQESWRHNEMENIKIWFIRAARDRCLLTKMNGEHREKMKSAYFRKREQY